MNSLRRKVKCPRKGENDSTNEQQKTNYYNTLQSLGIDPETLENETATTEQYKYAANIVDPVWDWTTNQNDQTSFEEFVQSLAG